MPGTIDGFSTATEMLRALRDRHVSAVELLDLHIQRIERHDPAINAVVTRDFERARDAAAADTFPAHRGRTRR